VAAAAPTRAADLLSALRLGSGVDIEHLTPDALDQLQLLDKVLSAQKLSGIITSGRRSSSVPSDHPIGRAVDFVIPGDMAGLAQRLKDLGFRAQYEQAGQVNPNGSVATGNHIHVSFKAGGAGGGPPIPLAQDPFARRPAPSPPIPLAQDPFASQAAAAPPIPLSQDPFARRGAAPAAPAPKAAAPRPSLGQRVLSGLVTGLTTPYRASVGFYNAAADEGQRIAQEALAQHVPPWLLPGYATAAFPEALAHGLKAAGQAALSPQLPEPRVSRTILQGAGYGPENVNPNLYGGLAVGDVLLSFLQDPSGSIYGPISAAAKERLLAQLAARAPKAAATGVALARLAQEPGALIQAERAAAAGGRGALVRATDHLPATAAVPGPTGLAGAGPLRDVTPPLTEEAIPPYYHRIEQLKAKIQGAQPAVERQLGALGIGRAAKAIRETFDPVDLKQENRMIAAGRVVQRVRNAEQLLRLHQPGYEGTQAGYELAGKGVSPLQDLVRMIVRDDALRGAKRDAKGLAFTGGGLSEPEAPGLPSGQGRPPATGALGGETVLQQALPAFAPEARSKNEAFAYEHHIPLDLAVDLARKVSREYEKGVRFYESTGGRAPGAGVRTEYQALGAPNVSYVKKPQVIAQRRAFIRRREVDRFLDELFGSQAQGRQLQETGQSAFAGRDVTLFGRAHVRDTIGKLVSAGKYVKPAPEPGAPLEAGYVRVPKARVFGTLNGTQVYGPVFDELKARMRRANFATSKGTRALMGPETGAQATMEAALTTGGRLASKEKKFLVSNPATLVANLAQNTAGGVLGAALNRRPLTEFFRELPEGFRAAIGQMKGEISPDVRRIEQRSRLLGQSYGTTISVAGSRSARSVAGVTGQVARPTEGGLPGAVAQLKGRPVLIPDTEEVRRIASNLGVAPNDITDRAAKIALFRVLEPHLGTDRAVKEVEKYLFDPTKRSAFLRALDQTGVLPFNFYTFRPLKMAAQVALERPDIPARASLLRPQLVQATGAQQNLEKAPENRRHLGLLPIGKNTAIDVARFTPLRDILATGQMIAGGQTNPARALIEQSLLRPFLEVGFNKQLFMGKDRPVFPDEAPLGNKAGPALRHLIENLSPSMVRGTRQLGEALAGQPTPAKTGEVESPVRVALRAYLGLPVIRLESQAERAARLNPEIAKRDAAVNAYLARAEASLGADTARNPYLHAFDSETDKTSLEHRLQASQRTLIQLAQRGSNTAAGKVTPQAKEELARQILWTKALESRYLTVIGALRPRPGAP
jgi:hypothetical protein